MRTIIKEARLTQGVRVICISDVHGELSYLRGLLKKIDLRPEEELILIGDMVEKGPDSLATLRYIMELKKTHRVRMVCGNCDGWDPELDFPTPRTDEFLRHYMNRPMGRRGLLCQMCDEIGFEVNEDMDAAAMREALRENFVPELDFLRSLPHVLHTEHYTFVHGGQPEGEPESWDAWRVMKNDNYLRQGRKFDKWQIVGHTPVVLYRETVTDANPIIDWGSRIISIDGGCVLKDDGQLNALIIPFDGSEDFSFDYYDPFPVRRVKTAQKASEDSCYIRWGDNVVRVLERGPEFSRCLHVRTGRELDILTKYLRDEDQQTRCNDCTDYVLPLKAGDEVSIIEETSRGYLVKHKGVSGWYKGELV